MLLGFMPCAFSPTFAVYFCLLFLALESRPLQCI